MGTAGKFLIMIGGVAAMAAVGWVMWVVVMPGAHDFVQDADIESPIPIPGQVADVTGDAGGLGADAAADGLSDVSGGLSGTASDVAGGAEAAAGGLTDAAEGIGDMVGTVTDTLIDVGDAVDDVLLPDNTNGNPDDMWEPPSGAPGNKSVANATGIKPPAVYVSPAPGDIWLRNDTGFKESLTHRYVKYPPCAAVVDDTGKAVRTIFGFPMPYAQDTGNSPFRDFIDQNHLAAQGFKPKPCAFDHNDNFLGDGWEDYNRDGYADGFADCTKPYVYADGWYVREKGRDCTYGAPGAIYEHRQNNPDRSGGSSNSGTDTDTNTNTDSNDKRAPPPPPTATPPSDVQPTVGRTIPYATAQTGTVSRVIDGDTIVIDRETTIRLALVDTPERGQAGYAEATAFTRKACPAGTAVIYDTDDGQRGGSYGRTIALVWCSGYGGSASNAAATLNEMLIADGHAVIDTRFCGASEFGDDEWAKRGGC